MQNSNVAEFGLKIQLTNEYHVKLINYENNCTKRLLTMNAMTSVVIFCIIILLRYVPSLRQLHFFRASICLVPGSQNVT